MLNFAQVLTSGVVEPIGSPQGAVRLIAEIKLEASSGCSRFSKGDGYR